MLIRATDPTSFGLQDRRAPRSEAAPEGPWSPRIGCGCQPNGPNLSRGTGIMRLQNPP